MKINFFKQECQDTTRAELFGLIDLEDKVPASININGNEKEIWNAIIKNDAKKEITFTAIDNCIPIYRPNGDMENRCDGMLTYADNIVFIVLKVAGKNKQWVEDGIKQLKKTIQVFSINHPLSNYRKKRAFLANKKRPQFRYSKKDQMQQFYNELNIRLIIHNIIKV